MRFLSLLAAIAMVALIVAPVGAASVQMNGDLIFEAFDAPLQYRVPEVPSDYPWWIILDSDSVQYYGSPCDPQDVVCVTREAESGDYFARFSKYPDTSGVVKYNNTELSELRTGYSYGQELEQWCPSPGHPVVMTETMRFGPNYNADGTGGAVGSSGGGLWNSYPDFPNQQLHPITAIWWSWAEFGSAFGMLDGLAVNVFKDGQLVTFQNVSAPIDMQNWMTWVITWSTAPHQKERITFTVVQNLDVYVIADVLTSPLGCLSVTNWNDNAFVSGFDQNLNPIVSHHSGEGHDYWDLTLMITGQH